MKKLYNVKHVAALLFTVVVGTSAALSHAADFPLQVDEAETLPSGTVELQVMLESARATAEGVSGRALEMELQVEYGAVKDVTLVLEVPLIRQKIQADDQTLRASGVGDALAGVKWRFFKRGDTHLGVKADLLLPTGAAEKGLGTGKLGSAIALLASMEQEDRYELHANVGVVMPRYKDSIVQSEARKALPRVALGALADVSDTWRVAAGVEAVRAQAKSESGWEKSLALGAIYDVGKARNVAFRVFRSWAGMEREIALAITYAQKL